MAEEKKKAIITTEVDNFGRKKFILEEREEENDEDEGRFMETGRNLSTLLGRDEKIKMKEYVGKTGATTKINSKKSLPFKCDVCSVSYSCDSALLDHLNSPAHNKKIGMNMNVKAVSIGTINQKIAELRKKAKGKKQTKYEKIMEKIEEGVLKKPESEQPRGQPQEERSVEAKNTVEKVNEDELQREPEKSEQVDEYLEQMKALGMPTSFGSKQRRKY